jgi:alcohol dehydrogenase (cytochrome c)
MSRFHLSVRIVAGIVSAGGLVAPLMAQREASPAALPSVLSEYHPVTADRLLKPEEQNWLMIRRTYDGWGFSPLAEINKENVSRLQQVGGFPPTSRRFTRRHRSSTAE